MDATTYTCFFDSPIGNLRLTGTEAGIQAVTFADAPAPGDNLVPDPLVACVQQLTEYFAGTRTTFDLLLAPAGTAFQQKVWQQLQAIPYGKTASYMEVAKSISGEKAIRAVGAANGRNPICVVVPCHRVIGSDGSLTGYSGGLWRKEWLLRHEGILKPQQQLALF